MPTVNNRHPMWDKEERYMVRQAAAEYPETKPEIWRQLLAGSC